MLLDYSIIGKRIKNTRLEKNIKQKELANELGVSIAYMSKIEKGNTKINLERLIQIARILNVCPAQLLNEINCEKKDYDFLKNDFVALIGKSNLRQRKLIYQISELVMKMKIE